MTRYNIIIIGLSLLSALIIAYGAAMIYLPVAFIFFGAALYYITLNLDNLFDQIQLERELFNHERD